MCSVCPCIHICMCFLSPAEHEHIAGRWIIRKRNQLLKTQLLTASVEAVRTVSSQRVIIAAWTILHGPQSFWALWMIWNKRDGHRNHHLHAGLDFLLPGNHQNIWDHMYCTVLSGVIMWWTKQLLRKERVLMRVAKTAPLNSGKDPPPQWDTY